MRKRLIFLRTGFLATTVSSFQFVHLRRTKYFERRLGQSTSNTWNAARSVFSAASFATMTSSSALSVDNHRCGLEYPELVVFDLDACFWDQEMYEMPSIPTQKNVVLGVLGGGPEPEKEGVIGVYSGRNKIALHPGALCAIQEHYRGREYPGMKICFASSADTPYAEQIGRASLKLLEVVPGVTIWDLVLQDWNQIDVNQIGRQPPLSRYVYGSILLLLLLLLLLIFIVMVIVSVAHILFFAARPRRSFHSTLYQRIICTGSNKAQTHFPRIRDMTGIPYHKMLFFDDWYVRERLHCPSYSIFVYVLFMAVVQIDIPNVVDIFNNTHLFYYCFT